MCSCRWGRTELPLHELIYFRDPIRDTVEGKPRAIIQTGLSQHERYLTANDVRLCVTSDVFFVIMCV